MYKISSRLIMHKLVDYRWELWRQIPHMLDKRFNSDFYYPAIEPEWKYQFHGKLTGIDSLEAMLKGKLS